MSEKCAWTYDECYWETDCGQSFEFTEGGPEDNRFKYCPYCGGTLAAEPLTSEE